MQLGASETTANQSRENKVFINRHSSIDNSHYRLILKLGKEMQINTTAKISILIKMSKFAKSMQMC